MNGINFVFNLIKSRYDYHEASSDIRIRCPFCGDSQKHPNSKHLYISKNPIPPYNTYMYHCFRAECGASGTLLEFLISQNLFSEIPQECISFLTKNQQIKNFSQSSVHIDLDKLTKSINPYKYEYVKKRLGLSEIPKFILLTLFDNFKDIPDTSVKYYIQKRLQNSFIGFKTFKRRKLICRNINHNEDWRYYNISFSHLPDFYITSPQLNNIDPLNKGTIVIAEGIFSVLRGYFHLKDSKYINEKNCILVASLGGKSVSFVHAYRYTCASLGIPDWNVVVLSDPDIHYTKYYLLKSHVYSKFTLLYNDYGDFGEDKIKVRLIKI